MNPEVDPEQAIRKIDEYLNKIKELLRTKFNIGESEKSELDTKIQVFIRATFRDDDKKLQDYKNAVHFYVGIVGVEETEQEKQEDYISRLTTMKNHLLAFKDELTLILNSQTKSGKLDKIENETQIRDAEARRRASVVEGKLWGAVIELIQMQRDELKKKGTLNQEIIEIRKDINDIKLMLSEFKKSTRESSK